MGNRHTPQRSRSLAAVEWQLILQCCALTQFMRLARVCKDSFAAGQQDFAWRTLLPLDVSRLPARWLTKPPRIPRESMLGRRDLTLLWRVALPKAIPHPTSYSASLFWTQPAVAPAELQFIQCLPNLRLLDSSLRHGVSDQQWGDLFRSEAFQQLRALILPGDVVRWSAAGMTCVSSRDESNRRIRVLQLVGSVALPQLCRVELVGTVCSAMVLTRGDPTLGWTLRLNRLSQHALLDLLPVPGKPPIHQMILSRTQVGGYPGDLWYQCEDSWAAFFEEYREVVIEAHFATDAASCHIRDSLNRRVYVFGSCSDPPLLRPRPTVVCIELPREQPDAVWARRRAD